MVYDLDESDQTVVINNCVERLLMIHVSFMLSVCTRVNMAKFDF